MPSNPSPPTASQSDPKASISQEISPQTPPQSADSNTQTSHEIPSQTDSTAYISHEKSPKTPPIRSPTPPCQSDSKTETSREILSRILEKLCQKVMQEDWDDVVNIYKNHKDIVSTANISRAKETALHVAISDGKIEVVKVLLSIIDPTKIREMKNDMDENPLHLAASLGQEETCKILVEMDPELIGARNKEGETPLFQAALHGKTAAFYALHPKCPINGMDLKHDIVHCKRNDGNSILHVAIQGEYFGLANQIISWYPRLVNFYNEKGLTALHVLAQNPSAFRSGCHLGPLDDFIYRCLIVDLPEVKTPSHCKDEHLSHSDVQLPGNYETCFNLLKLPMEVFTAIDKTNKKGAEKGVGSKKEGKTHKSKKEGKTDNSEKESKKGGSDNSTEGPLYPDNYTSFLFVLEFAMEFLLFVLGLGFFQVRKLRDNKRKHQLACQVLKTLISRTEIWSFHDLGSGPHPSFPTIAEIPFTEDEYNDAAPPNRRMLPLSVPSDGHHDLPSEGMPSPILVAAEMGLVEMVEEVLNQFPMAIRDEDSKKKNVLMLAAENGMLGVVNLLRNRCPPRHSIYQKVDKKGNTVLHLAAAFGKNRRCPFSSAAILIHWELQWYNTIKSSMPTNLWTRRNGSRRTSMEVFEETHADLVKDGLKWLNSTSESCSVVAALIASVAYASATTVPGGNNQDTGKPILKGQPAFDAFTIAALIALCCSVTSLTMFLSIITSNYTIQDFLHNLPTKLLLGLTMLFISIGAMMFSFCAGHFFNLGDQNRGTGLPIFAIICLPLSAYVWTQFRLFISFGARPF